MARKSLACSHAPGTRATKGHASPLLALRILGEQLLQ